MVYQNKFRDLETDKTLRPVTSRFRTCFTLAPAMFALSCLCSTQFPKGWL